MIEKKIQENKEVEMNRDTVATVTLGSIDIVLHLINSCCTLLIYIVDIYKYKYKGTRVNRVKMKTLYAFRN